jgi:hypothetical protein
LGRLCECAVDCDLFLDVFSGKQETIYLFSVLRVEVKMFFAKLSVLIALVVAAVVWEWRRTEERIAEVGQVRGSVELLSKTIKLLQQVPNAKVIMAGDSKAERQLDPQIFVDAGVPAVNIAVPSGDLYALVQNMAFLGLDKSPATFIFSVGSYQINDGHHDKDTYSAEQFFAYTPLERLRMFKSSYFLAARTMLKKEQVYRNYGAIAQNIMNSPGGYPNLGFLPVGPSDFSCQKFRHNSRVSPWSTYRDVKTDGARWRLFTEAVQKLSTWPGRYIIFNSPHSKKGIECLAGSYGEDLERAYSQKASEFIKPFANVRFADFFWEPPVPLPDSYYYDPGHLNKDGAEIFTRWWLAYLKQENWL